MSVHVISEPVSIMDYPSLTNNAKIRIEKDGQLIVKPEKTLGEGELVCDQCHGEGYVHDEGKKCICKKCFGSGKTDWIENVRGKRLYSPDTSSVLRDLLIEVDQSSTQRNVIDIQMSCIQLYACVFLSESIRQRIQIIGHNVSISGNHFEWCDLALTGNYYNMVGNFFKNSPVVIKQYCSEVNKVMISTNYFDLTDLKSESAITFLAEEEEHEDKKRLCDKFFKHFIHRR